MPPTTPAAARAIDKLVAETGSLYSLPAVALEVLRLTENETVDAAALKRAIEGDPALVVKLLKVVNSSLFGLSGEVSNLTQALALLGARPLRMLVLGFSLPDALLAEASAEELQRFWRASLTRALVARDLAAEHFETPLDGPTPDDAFVAGLLHGVGGLVLFGRLGEPYARLLRSGAEELAPPNDLERRSLGFTHAELSAGLAAAWRLPPTITRAIALAAEDRPLGGPLHDPADALARPLRLADLLVRLVVDEQPDALPLLLEEGADCCGLTERAVRDLVEELGARVTDLAAAMAAPLAEGADYQQIMTDAQARLALVAGNAAADPASPEDDTLCEALLAECHELRLAMRQFLGGKPRAAAGLLRAEGAHKPTTDHPTTDQAATDRAAGADSAPGVDDQQRGRLLDALEKLARQTRASRHALSLALVQVDGDLEHRPTDRRLRDALAGAGGQLAGRHAARLTLGPRLVALLLPGIGRAEGVGFVQEVDRLLAAPNTNAPPLSVDGSAPTPLTLHAGLASIDAVPNRFDPGKLLEAAEGCLSAARSSATRRVRSIEVY